MPPVRSRWTNQFTELSNQSNFHNKVREILATDSILCGFASYQEVPVRDLVPDYPHIHFYDWYIEPLNLIVELHGQQHYKATNFGNISYSATQRAFQDIKKRDAQKKTAAEAAGFSYLEISYKHYAKLNNESLKTLLFGVNK